MKERNVMQDIMFIYTNNRCIFTDMNSFESNSERSVASYKVTRGTPLRKAPQDILRHYDLRRDNKTIAPTQG